MAKMLVEVHTPGNGNIYEFRLDDNLTVFDVKIKMIEEISELENKGITLEEGKTLLLDYHTRCVLSENETVKSVGVKSGHRLILV